MQVDKNTIIACAATAAATAAVTSFCMRSGCSKPNAVKTATVGKVAQQSPFGANPPPTPTKEDFVEVYHEIKKVLLEDAAKNEMDSNRVAYLGEMMDATCLGGKYNRGMTVFETAHQLALDANVSKERYQQIIHDGAVCGWAIEFLQAHFLVEDDIMDQSETRRGKPCWYKHPGVTTEMAINDGLILLAWCTIMIQHFFKGNPAKEAVMTILHREDYHTCLGQFYDITGMVDSHDLNPNTPYQVTKDFTEFTLTHYNRIVKYKTCYYTYYLPLAFAKAICYEFVPAELDVEPFSISVGTYFQIQDDFLDCFGDPAVTQKIGTDIEDKKCSWLAATFLATASKEDVATWKANYGQHDAEKVQLIKGLYRKYDLEGKFAQYEEGIVTVVDKQLKEMERHSVAFARGTKSLWDKTYKRKK